MPTWLKPSYIAIAVLLLLVGIQTVRLSGATADTAREVASKATLVAQIAEAHSKGVQEGARLQKEAQVKLDAQHATIVAGLEADKVELQKHYNQTYGMLRDLAATPKYACLNEPLPEEMLKEFR